MKTCTRCGGSGFLNLCQVPDAYLVGADEEKILAWIKYTSKRHNVQVCDCCGDGEAWYGAPGEHYGLQDPPGQYGPYSYNGGLCECD